MYVLLTRPRQDSEALAARLQAKGRACLLEPMLTIRPLAGVRLSLESVQAFLLTSANGARALATATAERTLPVYAVGTKTAAEAQALAFENVYPAAGDTRALADLVAEKVDRKAGALLHAAGKTVAGDLAGALAERGYDVRREVLYEALPTQEFSAATAAALRKGEVGVVLFFSPRTAATFVRLVGEAGFAPECKRITALCLSAAVAKAADAIQWQSLRIAAHPDEGSLLQALERL